VSRWFSSSSTGGVSTIAAGLGFSIAVLPAGCLGLALGSGDETCRGDGLTGRCAGRKEPLLLDGEEADVGAFGVIRPLGGPGGRMEVASGERSGRSGLGTGAGRYPVPLEGG
jgi:hypothetical protein